MSKPQALGDESPDDQIDPANLNRIILGANPKKFRNLLGKRSPDSKSYPTKEDLERMHGLDAFNLKKHKRIVAIILLYAAAFSFCAVAIMFLGLTGYWIWMLAAGDLTWITDRVLIQEILKTGWTVTATLIAVRFSSIIFDEKDK